MRLKRGLHVFFSSFEVIQVLIFVHKDYTDCNNLCDEVIYGIFEKKKTKTTFIFQKELQFFSRVFLKEIA